MLKEDPVIVTNSNGDAIQKYALLNAGSNTSPIEDHATQLNPKCLADTLNIRDPNCTEWEQNNRRVQLKIRGKRTRSSHVTRARIVKGFHLMNQTQEPPCHEHLQNLDPSEGCYQHARPRMLTQLIVSNQLLTGSRDEPAASRTELGWVSHGINNQDLEHMLHPSEAVKLQHLRYYNTRGVRTLQRTVKEQRFAKGLNRIRAGPVTKRSCHLAKLEPTLEYDSLQVYRRLNATIVSNTARRHLFTRQLTHDRAVGPLNSERTWNVVQRKCWAMMKRAKRKRVALKCFPSCARRPKGSAAYRLHSNPCDYRNDPYDPSVLIGDYFQADESCIPTSTQHQLLDMRRTNQNLWRRVSSNNQEARRPNEQ